jgi:hypothetical protein
MSEWTKQDTYQLANTYQNGQMINAMKGVAAAQKQVAQSNRALAEINKQIHATNLSQLEESKKQTSIMQMASLREEQKSASMELQKLHRQVIHEIRRDLDKIFSLDAIERVWRLKSIVQQVDEYGISSKLVDDFDEKEMVDTTLDKLMSEMDASLQGDGNEALIIFRRINELRERRVTFLEKLPDGVKLETAELDQVKSELTDAESAVTAGERFLEEIPTGEDKRVIKSSFRKAKRNRDKEYIAYVRRYSKEGDDNTLGHTGRWPRALGTGGLLLFGGYWLILIPVVGWYVGATWVIYHLTGWRKADWRAKVSPIMDYETLREEITATIENIRLKEYGLREKLESHRAGVKKEGDGDRLRVKKNKQEFDTLAQEIDVLDQKIKHLKSNYESAAKVLPASTLEGLESMGGGQVFNFIKSNGESME